MPYHNSPSHFQNPEEMEKRSIFSHAATASPTTAMHPAAAAPSASAPAGINDEDDFHWDDAAEAELQAIEAAYASASASAKRRRLPDWTSPSPFPSLSCRPRYSYSPVSGSSTPSWIHSPHTPRGAVPLFSAPHFPHSCSWNRGIKERTLFVLKMREEKEYLLPFALSIIGAKKLLLLANITQRS